MLGISWGIVSVVVLLAYGSGFRGALDAGFRGAFSDGTDVAWPGQTSLQAGGERAGKRVRVTAGDVRVDRRAAAREERQPGVHAGVPGRLRQQAVEPSRPRRVGELRLDAQRDAAARRPLPRRGRRPPAPPRRVHRQRGAAEALRRHPAGRRDDPHRRPAVRDRRRHGGEGADFELQPARPLLHLHPVDDDGRADRQPLRRRVRLSGGVADARGEGDAAGARAPREALSLQPDRRARAQHLRLGAGERRSPTACRRDSASCSASSAC